jgi:hypothetical protein
MTNPYFSPKEIDAAIWMCNLLDICDCCSNVLAVLRVGVADIPVRQSERGVRGAIVATERLAGWLKQNAHELNQLHRVGASAMQRDEEGRDNGAEYHC